MSNPTPTPAASRTPRNARWWRVAGLTIDAFLLALIAQSWNLPVLRMAQSLVGGGAPAAEGVQFGSRGFHLLGVEGEVLGLAFTLLVIALQTPFLLRSSSLGLTLCGLEMRVGEERASTGQSIGWTAGAWLLSLMGPYGVVLLLASGGSSSAPLAVIGLTLAGIALTNMVVGLRTGASILDRAFGLHAGGRQAAAPAGDHLGEWKPRDTPPRVWSSTVDDEAKLWRQHSTADPLGPFLGPGVSAMPKAPDEPEHVEHMNADNPFAAVGGVAEVDPERQALVERLRRAADQA
ncbi:MAG: hypothetical protein AB8H79_07425 [Myxococcota bacterium]